MTEKHPGIKKKYGYSMIFSEKSYYKPIKQVRISQISPFLVNVILVVASRLLLSTTFM